MAPISKDGSGPAIVRTGASRRSRPPRHTPNDRETLSSDAPVEVGVCAGQGQTLRPPGLTKMGALSLRHSGGPQGPRPGAQAQGPMAAFRIPKVGILKMFPRKGRPSRTPEVLRHHPRPPIGGSRDISQSFIVTSLVPSRNTPRD